MKFLALISAIVFLALGVGCGSSGSDPEPTHVSQPEPGVLVAHGPPPSKLIVKDIRKGTGPVAEKGEEVVARNIHLYPYKPGREYEFDWRGAETFDYTFDGGEVLEAWDRGLRGIRFGGRRELLVPASQAYAHTPAIYLIELRQPLPVFRKPTVHYPSGPPPKKLVVKNLKVGDGAEAKAHDWVTIQYLGAGYRTKKKFDSTWERRKPYLFHLGIGRVLPGWDKGIQGMKVGGRRELIIPPRLTLQELGSDETLIYIVDLLKVE